MGRIPGTIALFGCFLIMIIILAVLALIVVKALAESPWGMFTVMATIPIAMFMGVYMRYIRPGRIGEISIIGVVLLLLSIWLGGQVAADPVWGPAFTFTGVQITWMLVGYGSWLPCCRYGWCWRRVTTCRLSSRSAPSWAWRSVS